MSRKTEHGQTWSSYNIELYTTRTGPPLGTLFFKEIEQQAREKLRNHPSAFLYVYGSAGQGAACDANVSELAKWMFVPRMLRDATVRNIQTSLFGVKHSSPLVIAPIGVQGLMHPDADIATAQAAANVGVTFTMSSASTRTIEQVGEACGSNHRWYQLYWPIQDDITLSLLKRAKASGFHALVVTLDTPTIGYRPHDLAQAYLPFVHGWGSQVGLSDPVFMAKLNEPVRTNPPMFPYEPEKLDKLVRDGDEKAMRTNQLAVEWQKNLASGKFRTWEDLKFLKDNWDGPIILKGIMSVKDAELAIDYGMDGIVVSNHGGRQVEGSVPTFWALRKICASLKVKEAQKSEKLTVLFDSGIRTGSDIIKAIAAGAQAVMLGRPFMYGLATGGKEGVEQVIRSILADCELTMGLAGFKDLEELQAEGEEMLVKIDDTHQSEPRLSTGSRL
ncbi:oxidoreductase [Cytidiella melzeri]|nr:oxidoreductase [Cytidiella melzeri]